MKHMLRRTAIGVAVSGLLAVVPGTTEALGDGRTYLTFDRPVALPGVTLGAGKYTFELPSHDRSIVRVSSRDGSRVFLTAFTRVVARPRGIGSDRHVKLGEAPPGQPTPIQVWYLSSGESGREFIYRK